MKTKHQASQKLISFTQNPNDFARVKKELDGGWNLVSLVHNANHYVGIIEKPIHAKNHSAEDEEIIFIPPRKKLTVKS